MGILTLASVQCTSGLGSGEQVSITPFFLNSPVNSSTDPATVTLTGNTPADFPFGTRIIFDKKGAPLYLHTTDGAVFGSDAYFWDTDTEDEPALFLIVLDPTGKRSDLEFTLYYDLRVGFARLLINTIVGIGIKLALFVKSLVALAILNPIRFILGRRDQDKKKR